MGSNFRLQVADDEIYLVVNAGCREKDINHMRKHLDAFSVSILPRSCIVRHSLT